MVMHGDDSNQWQIKVQEGVVYVHQYMYTCAQRFAVAACWPNGRAHYLIAQISPKHLGLAGTRHCGRRARVVSRAREAEA